MPERVTRKRSEKSAEAIVADRGAEQGDPRPSEASDGVKG